MHGNRPTVSSLNGVVAAAHPLAAQAGARLLNEGGNAFDAAVATAAALNVVEPYMSGLAGMGVATCYVAAEKRVRALDFVTAIPENLPVERFRVREDLLRGALAVGAPGNFAGWSEMSRAHGRKSMREALAPAIALARGGFPLIEFNVDEINGVSAELRGHAALYDAWARNYTAGTGGATPGAILKQPDLAATLESLAESGATLLHGGALGRAVVAHLQSLGGCLTLGDLERVRPVWQEPLVASYRGLAIHVPPPSCEAFQYLLTLRILEGFDIAAMERNGAAYLDLVWRAIRLAAGVRIADNNPTPERLAHMLSDGHVETLRARVRDGVPVVGPTEQWTETPGAAAAEGHTTSFSIADRDGNVVCLTQSLGSVFGSGVVVPGTGVCLNNFLYWADVNPRSPNRSKPGGPLPVCVAPSVALRDGRPVLALGTPGSYGILQTQVQALLQHVDFGLPLQAAIEAPRARLMDGVEVVAEGRLAPAVLATLGGRGHAVETLPGWTMKVGGMQGVAIDPATGAMTGAADPRRDGYVVAV
ncbi:MAG: gamma-glutamyltransferase [Rhodospirillales bacterium]|nr:gamma-glutamyltransferase [Rhodospirillales bacterium]